MMTQTKAIHDHLIEHGSITSLDAIKEYGVTRLSAIIYILRHEQGCVINSIPKQSKNRFGHNVNFSEYRLER